MTSLDSAPLNPRMCAGPDLARGRDPLEQPLNPFHQEEQTLVTTTVDQTPDPRDEYVKGLRALADILEAHPEVPLPYQGSVAGAAMTFHFLHAADPRAEMAATRRALGVTLDKDVWSNYFDLSGSLFGLHFKLTAFRADVCERVVTGTREVEVEEPDPQALADLPKIRRTVTVEDVEWQCHPILANADQAATVTR